ncbi:hypothetical protein C1H46_006356 [Malus baccata]|uniref:Uncharacterized protein n=1 Tax=Malus baccata TaxID=106549 RepID=A0A540NAL3_MALBA|nr:hypothetical protein C1H46_006356 [Malus baccata]
MASFIALRRTSSMKLSPFFNMRPLAPSLFPSIRNSRIQTLSTITVPETMKIEKSIRNQTDVGLRMMKPLFLNEGENSNIVYSPLSIHSIEPDSSRYKGSNRGRVAFFPKVPVHCPPELACL